MPFSAKVQEDAMVACNRHCCLCHRLKHTKMQCHHITPQSDGGDDTFENCIPLCLECHGEVMAYNPKHPIGKMYTPEEMNGTKESRMRRQLFFISFTWRSTANCLHGFVNVFLRNARKLFLRSELQSKLSSTGSGLVAAPERVRNRSRIRIS
jgi:HNH endonuclease